MEEYLSETYGVTVYQEQVMLLSQKLGGFSKGDADVLRKAMGKKQKAVLDKMKGQFVEGAMKKGHDAKILEKIWTDWEAFAQYAFNKSHSVCYAFVAYQTAYLKAHYPAEYMAAVLNNAGSIDKIRFFMEECQRMELPVLGPDVNESLKGFAVPTTNTIRFGMNAVKGVGEAAVEDIIREREENGAYLSVHDFICRINQKTVNKKTLESLVLAGALDGFKELHRAQYFYRPAIDPESGLDRLVKFGNQVQGSKSVAANSLFGEMAMPDVKPPAIPECEPWNLSELLEKEKEVVGIYISAHPLDGFKFEMDHYGFLPIAELENCKGKQVKLAGFVSDAAHMVTKKGSKFGKFFINDYSGNFEITMWENNYVQWGNFLDNGQKLVITGVYGEHRFRPGVMEFSISSVTLLANIRKSMTKRISIGLHSHQLNEEMVAFLVSNIKQSPGSTELVIQVRDEEEDQVIRLRGGGKFSPDDAFLGWIQERGIPYHIELAS